MNERLLDICIKAGINTWPFNEVGFISLDESELVKFAELIVAECALVAINKDSGYMHPADVAGYMAAGRSTAAQMIKEHFGVEE